MYRPHPQASSFDHPYVWACTPTAPPRPSRRVPGVVRPKGRRETIQHSNQTSPPPTPNPIPHAAKPASSTIVRLAHSTPTQRQSQSGKTPAQRALGDSTNQQIRDRVRERQGGGKSSRVSAFERTCLLHNFPDKAPLPPRQARIPHTRTGSSRVTCLLTLPGGLTLGAIEKVGSVVLGGGGFRLGFFLAWLGNAISLLALGSWRGRDVEPRAQNFLYG
jgi:hypothetical protein